MFELFAEIKALTDKMVGEAEEFVKEQKELLGIGEGK